MKTIRLRIADLRKARKLTQQEVADAIGCSFQSVSKWENENGMPDITMLPLLAEYFQVTVDQLLGLAPLDEEKYIPRETADSSFWNEKLDYLLRTRKSLWNTDYMEFLINKVWKIDRPIRVLDCGCGYGFLGLLLMPLLPQGSTYTGIDFSEKLLEQGRLLFEQEHIKARLIRQNVFEYQAKGQYDLVISQAVLRHLNAPDTFIKKMIDFGKEGAHIICIDVNREFECDGLYIDGMDYAALCRHEGLEKNWQTELNKQGRDYAIGIRAAHMMEKLGLHEVGVRMNDKVEFVTPRTPDYAQLRRDFLKHNDWSSDLSIEEKEKVIQSFLSHGVSLKEAEEYCSRNIMITKYFAEHSKAGYTFMRGMMISYGKKRCIAD